jgi:hypothetical protein
MWKQAEQRHTPTTTTTTTSTNTAPVFAPQSNSSSSTFGSITNKLSDLFSFSPSPQQPQQQQQQTTNTSAPTPAKLKKLRFRQADTNVVSVDFGTLGEEAQIATGDPVHCKQCQALFSAISKLNTNPENDSQVN